MKRFGLTMVALLALYAIAAQSQDAAASNAVPAKADSSSVTDKPYETIVARNIFGLLPIPPPDTNPPAPIDPPPKIVPTGIMTIFGRDQALFKAGTKPKPGQAPKEQSYVLSEGEREDDIEVVKIDHAKSEVTFNNHGTVQTLPLVPDTNPSGGSSGGGGGGSFFNSSPNGSSGGIPRPNMISAADRANMFRARQQAAAGGMNPGQPSGNGQSSEGSIEDQVMAAARNMAIIEQNRLATQDAVDNGQMPPIPPTMLTPGDARGGPGGAPLLQPMVPGGAPKP